jgi:hypothetical protein
MKLRGPVPNSHIHVSVSDLCIPTSRSSYFAAENKRTKSGNLQIAHRYMNVEIGYEAAQFHLWEYINLIFFAVQVKIAYCSPNC